ncbi:MAG TPA: hypothetical protein VIJ89_03155 [Deferrimonas sp.]
MEFLKYDTRRFFLFGIRFFFGAWLLYVGLSKWIFMGPGVFVGYVAAQFDKTWSPHLLTIGQTILMKPDIIANWQFLVLVLLCAALS